MSSIERLGIFVASLFLYVCAVSGQNAFTNDIVKDIVHDWSESPTIEIEQPRCAYMNITDISAMPITKNTDMHVVVEVYDDNGNYFKKKALLNAQGNSSLIFPKKNFAIDFVEDVFGGQLTTKITIGNWVEMDSYHFKANYIDYFRGIANVGYRLYDEIIADHESYQQRAGLETITAARCYPDGFPCIVYLNGDFYGIYSWSIKKHRDNMNLDKSLAGNIHLDGKLTNATLFGGNIDWTAFEVRNPKSLKCVETEVVSGWEYQEIDSEEPDYATAQETCEQCEINPSKLTKDDIDILFGGNAPQYLMYVTSKGKTKYYRYHVVDGLQYASYNGDEPKELIDATMDYFDPRNKQHVQTDEVKIYIKNLSGYCNELKAMEKSNDVDALKTRFEECFDVVSLVDYTIFSAVMNNYDGFGKNWQWFTYNGKKWFLSPYDLDGLLGYYYTGYVLTDPMTNTYGWTLFTSMAFSIEGPMRYIKKYYYQNLVDRYLELRETGVLDVNHILDMLHEWYDRVGSDNYEQEWIKWNESFCISETIANEGWTTTDSWVGYESILPYSDNTEYEEGMQCTYKSRIWTATKNQKGVVPCSKIGFTDSFERVKFYLEERIKIADAICDYKPLNIDCIKPYHGVAPNVIYDLTGTRKHSLQKGINIVRNVDGQMVKVYVR